MLAKQTDRPLRLWVVNDSVDYSIVVTAKVVFTDEERFRPYCGAGMLEQFMNDFESVAGGGGVIDFFLLDVYMPVPRKLEEASYWGEAACSDTRCGFALARWLVDTQNVDVKRIVMVSANRSFQNDRIKFGFDERLTCLPGWHKLTVLTIRKWIRENT